MSYHKRHGNGYCLGKEEANDEGAVSKWLGAGGGVAINNLFLELNDDYCGDLK